MKTDTEFLKELNFESVAISGGGQRVAAMLEFLRVLFAEGIFNSVDSVSGTSAGAMVAGLLAINCPPEEILKLLLSANLKEIAKDPKHLVPLNLYTRGGLHSADGFESLFIGVITKKCRSSRALFNQIITKPIEITPAQKQKLEAAGLSFESACITKEHILSILDKGANLTYNDLHKLKLLNDVLIEQNFFKGKKYEKKDVPYRIFRDLSTIAYNINSSKTETFSFDTNHAETTIKDGLRASMSIPFYFIPKEINGQRYIDGAVSSNNPSILQSDTRKKLIIDLDYSHKIKPELERLSNKKYYKLVISTILNALQKDLINNQNATVITIDTGKLESLEFNASEEKITEIGKTASDLAIEQLRISTETTSCPSSTIPNIPLSAEKNIVFSGDSFSVAGLLGVTKALNEEVHKTKYAKVGGHGAGSIIATLFALNANQEQIATAILKHETLQRHFELSLLRRLQLKKGLFSNKDRKTFINELLLDVCKDADITFAGLKAKGFKDLHLRVYNLTKQELEIFSAETAPNMKIADALLIATNTAILNKPVYLDSNKKITIANKGSNIYISADLCRASPVNMFDTITSKNPNTIGFYVYDPTRNQNNTIFLGLVTVIKAVYNAIKYATEDIAIVDDRIVRIELKQNEILATKHHVLKTKLCEEGYSKAYQHFSSKSSEPYPVDETKSYSLQFPEHQSIMDLILEYIVRIFKQFIRDLIDLMTIAAEKVVEFSKPGFEVCEAKFEALAAKFQACIN